MDTVLTVDGHNFDLSHLHLPTGWVLLEEVIRFIIADLGFEPLCEDWEKRITESEQMFREVFSSRS